MFPLIGGNQVSHLEANIQALSLELGPEDVAEIDRGYDFDVGFPNNFINMACTRPPTGPADVSFLTGMGHFDYVAPASAIKPYQADAGADGKA